MEHRPRPGLAESTLGAAYEQVPIHSYNNAENPLSASQRLDGPGADELMAVTPTSSSPSSPRKGKEEAGSEAGSEGGEGGERAGSSGAGSSVGTSLTFDTALFIPQPRPRQLIRPRQRMAQIWDDDEAVHACTRCKVAFSKIPLVEPARHHCRACGRIFCNACSDTYIELPYEFERFPERRKSQRPGMVASVYASVKSYVTPASACERVCGECAYQWGDLQDREVRQTIAVFEILKLDIFELRTAALVCTKWAKAARFWVSAFRQLQYMLPSHAFDARERSFLARNARHLVGHSAWMVQLLRVTNWDDAAESARAAALTRASRTKTCHALRCTRACRAYFQPSDILQLLRIVPHPDIRADLAAALRHTPTTVLAALVPSLVALVAHDPIANSPLAELLYEIATLSLTVASDIFWALKVAVSAAASTVEARIYTSVLHTFLVTLGAHSSDTAEWAAVLLASERLDDACADLASSDAAGAPVGVRAAKAFAMHGLFDGGTTSTAPVLPRAVLAGLQVGGVSQFTSARAPLLLPFVKADGGVVRVLYKEGDDLRRDQAMVSIIAIMDAILREAGHEFPVVKYRVVPTGHLRGFIEIVPEAKTLEQISKSRTVAQYLLDHNRERTPDAYLRDFVLSTAVYTVMTYLLGVGDRHQDNVMLTTDGRLFHIDFGFLMGEEPFKLVPSSWLSLTPQVRDAMLAQDRDLFMTTCADVYNILRRYAPLFMTILSLGTGVDLSDCADEIKLRFLPGVGDAEATVLFLNRLKISGQGSWAEALGSILHSTINNDEPNLAQTVIQSVARLPSWLWSTS